MSEIIKKILTNVLAALYQPFVFSIILAVLLTFLYMYANEFGWKMLLKRWVDSFKNSKEFRKVCVLTFYITMILFKTLLNRSLWPNPLSNVIGVWGLYRENGTLTTEVVENFILFVPFTVLMFWCFREKVFGRIVSLSKIIWQAVKIVFLFSLVIEFLQLFLCVGTFQLSDLFYNTLGGLVGGFVYWCGYKFVHKSKK